MREQIAALRAQFEPRAREAYEVAKRKAVRAYRVTSRVSRRSADAILGGLEAILLSAPARERVHATATFALIFMFAVTSVDFLVAGGAEFVSPARAAQTHTIYAAQAAPRETTVLPPLADDFAAAPPALVADTMATSRRANVITVSQSFTPRPAASAELVPVSADADAPLAGETEAAPAPPEPAAPPAPAGKRAKPSRAAQGA